MHREGFSEALLKIVKFRNDLTVTFKCVVSIALFFHGLNSCLFELLLLCALLNMIDHHQKNWIIVSSSLSADDMLRYDFSLDFRGPFVKGKDPRIPIITLNRERLDISIAPMYL